MKRFRDAITGLFTTPDMASSRPDTTVAETVSDGPEVEAKLRWRIGGCVAALVDAAAALERHGDRAGAIRARAVASDHIPEEKA